MKKAREELKQLLKETTPKYNPSPDDPIEVTTSSNDPKPPGDGGAPLINPRRGRSLTVKQTTSGESKEELRTRARSRAIPKERPEEPIIIVEPKARSRSRSKAKPKETLTIL